LAPDNRHLVPHLRWFVQRSRFSRLFASHTFITICFIDFRCFLCSSTWLIGNGKCGASNTLMSSATKCRYRITMRFGLFLVKACILTLCADPESIYLKFSQGVKLNQGSRNQSK
jgi:hypothetical protein